MNIVYAKEEDINNWMELLGLVEENFPGLDKEEYRNALEKCIIERHALIAKIKDNLAGVLTFSDSKELTFLAVHPLHQRKGIAKALILKLISQLPVGTKLSVTTYREGDPMGIAARKLYRSIGFNEGELLTVFDYPCQVLYYIQM